MAATLLAMLERQEIEGRERELAALEPLVAGEAGADAACAATQPVAAWVHGIAGSGKSALLRAFSARARERGAAVVAIDCRTVEPTVPGVLAALSRALDAPLETLPEAAEALRALGERVVLSLDAYHVLGLADSWVRLSLLPALPAGARVVIASREAPKPAWRAELGPLLRTIALGPLEPAAAEALLHRAGIPAARAREVNRFAHGHPLSLLLAASALAERPNLAIAQTAMPAMADALARLYLDGLDAETRRALDAASVTRRTTLSLLGAMLPGVAPQDAFERLRALPFTELGADGLVIQDTVREAVAATLRAGDPAAHRRLKTAAWHHLRAEVRDAAPTDLWRYTADMLYLIENPAVRDIYFPTTAPQHAHEPARPEDWQGIEAIVRAFEPPQHVAILRRWWEHAPEAFVVARDLPGSVSGYYLLFVPRDVSPRLLDADPLTRAWRDHSRAEPLGHGQISLFIRHWGTRVGGYDPAPGEPSICLDVKRTYLELRPALGRVYLASRDVVGTEKLRHLGFDAASDHDVQLGGRTYHTLFADFGTGSVDGWLAELGARELGLAGGGPLDLERHQLVLDGGRVDLTRLELGVLRHLHEREGRVVARAELFREVWGTEWVGDGNALEAVVSGLRRKLGDRAKALETVRGAGYRLRSLS